MHKHSTMARIAGISTQKDSKGNILKVTFDLKKHGAEIMPILVKIGAVEEDEFEKQWKEGIPADVFFEEWKNKIRTRWAERE